MLQDWVASSGTQGPLNLYAPSKWKLLGLFLGTFSQDIEWHLLDTHWGTGEPLLPSSFVEEVKAVATIPKTVACAAKS